MNILKFAKAENIETNKKNFSMQYKREYTYSGYFNSIIYSRTKKQISPHIIYIYTKKYHFYIRNCTYGNYKKKQFIFSYYWQPYIFVVAYHLFSRF